MNAPLTIYVVHHPECKEAQEIAKALYAWFRLGYLSGDSSAAGVPVYFRRQLDGRRLDPDIRFGESDLNVVIALVDEKMVVNQDWRHAIVDLARAIKKINQASNNDDHGRGKALLLPAAIHDSFYRTGPLYEGFNPIRLIGMDEEQMISAVRRATTEATARAVRTEKSENPPPLDVFISHAKRDGIPIAEAIRDGVRKFAQVTAWFDANDLPYGSAWESPMVEAAARETAALISVMTDAYPTRPWCRREALLARTPSRVEDSNGVWKVQPTVAVHQPGDQWVRGLSMLEGVPCIGWNDSEHDQGVEQIVDRLVLEVMLGNVHRKLAKQLEANLPDNKKAATVFTTWVPDAWTLAALRSEVSKLQIKDKGKNTPIDRVVYPGYGLTVAEMTELNPVVECFAPEAMLVTFEEVWNERPE